MESEEKPYEIIDHTADIGLRVIAPTLAELFAKAAYDGITWVRLRRAIVRV